jgi:hypothetical protein
VNAFKRYDEPPLGEPDIEQSGVSFTGINILRFPSPMNHGNKNSLVNKYPSLLIDFPRDTGNAEFNVDRTLPLQ